MKAKIILWVLLMSLFSSKVFAQVKIGSNATTLQEGSILELEANGNKAGLKIAEIALTSILDATTLPVQEMSKGTLVWNTATAGTAPNNVTPGFYIWMGTKWEKILSSASGNTKTIYDGNGKLASNRTIEMDTLSLAYTSEATNGTSHFSVDGTTFNVNAADNRVGIGNANPMATLDVAGNPTNTTSPDGVIVPRITRAQLIAKTVYGTNQTGAMIYITDLSGTVNAQTANVTATGLYFFNGTVWQKVIQDSVANSYMFVRATAQQTVNLNSNINFSTIDSQTGSDISFNTSTSVFTLKAGKTYKLTGIIPWASNTWSQWAWYNITGSTQIGSIAHQESTGATAGTFGGGTGVATAYVTPTSDIQVAFRFVRGASTSIVGDTSAAGAQASAVIEVVSGSLAAASNSNYKETLYARRITTNQTVNAGQDIILNSATGNIPYNTATGIVTLRAGVQYTITADMSVANITNTYAQYALVDATTNAIIETSAELVSTINTSNNSDAMLVLSYTPTSNQTVKLRVILNGFTVRSDLYSYLRITAEGTSDVSKFVGMLSNDYNELNTYPSGTIIVKDGSLYQANSTITAGTPFVIGLSGATFKSLSQRPEQQTNINNLIPFSTSWGLNVRYNDTNKQFEWMLSTSKFVRRMSTWSGASSFSQIGGGTITCNANEWNTIWTDSSLNLLYSDQETMTIRIADSQLAMSTGNYVEYEVIATVGSGGNSNHVRVIKNR